jgi:hypothetical protein
MKDIRALFNQVLGMTLKENFLALMIEQKDIIQKSFNRFVEKELRKFRI